MPDLDLHAATAWSESVARTADVTIQTFADRKDARARGAAAQVVGGQLAELWPWICRQQAQGAGVFVTVNRTPAGQRRVADVLAVRALFVDIDGRTEQPAWHLPPSCVVSSGRGLHGYWSLDPWEAPDAAAFRSAQHRLARHYGSDPSVCDLPRVMRLPGTLHQKGDPRQVSILDCTGAAYCAGDVLAGIADLPPPQRQPVAQLAVIGGRIDIRTVDVVQVAQAAGLRPRRLPSADGPDPAWAIDCPWRAEHTDGRQGETATVVWQRGVYPPAFRCLHAHCSDRRLAQFLARLGATVVAPHAQITQTRSAELALHRAATRLEGLR